MSRYSTNGVRASSLATQLGNMNISKADVAKKIAEINGTTEDVKPDLTKLKLKIKQEPVEVNNICKRKKKGKPEHYTTNRNQLLLRFLFVWFSVSDFILYFR